jgi:hypothetical protein
MMVARVVGNYLFKDLVRFSIMLAVMFAALFLYYTKRIPQMIFCVIVFLLAVVDFYLVDRHILHPEEFRKHEQLRIIHDRDVVENYKQSDGMIETLQRDERPFRVFPMDSAQRPFSALFSSNRFMVFGISSIGGYHPAKLMVYQQFFDGLRRALGTGNFQAVDMLNVRYFVTAAKLPNHPLLKPIWSGTNYRGEPRFIYQNAGCFPRAWLVDSYRVADEQQALDLIATGGVDLSREAILLKEPPIKPGPAGQADSAFAVVEKLGFNEVRVTTSSDAPAILVLSEVYYPDWKVEVDGRPVEMLRADFILRAVALDGGEHEVVFRYDTSLIKKSAYASATTLGVVTLILIAGSLFAWRDRRSGSSGSRSDV